jgi:hypothetical protein
MSTLIGKRFGARLVLREAGVGRSGGEHRAEVMCDCGDLAWVLAADLRAGRSRSCRPCMSKRRKAMALTKLVARMRNLVRLDERIVVSHDKRNYPKAPVPALEAGLWRVVGSWAHAGHPGALLDLESVLDPSFVAMAVPASAVAPVELPPSETGSES